ncbi:MAG: hypothetical protein C0614_07395, partial [Desulfuromonas sp.]
LVGLQDQTELAVDIFQDHFKMLFFHTLLLVNIALVLFIAFHGFPSPALRMRGITFFVPINPPRKNAGRKGPG